MNVVIDRGNTLVKLAVFDEEHMVFFYRSKKLTDDKILQTLSKYPIDSGIVSNVANVSFSEDPFFELDHYISLGHETNLPFVNKYATPETLGRDRMAAVAGAIAEFPNRNLLVIDTGTCLTIDFVNQRGEYLGGNISPGPEIRFQGMHDGTANLPRVQWKDQESIIGSSTESALQLGGFVGCAAEIMGWMTLAREQMDEIIVVLSGGDAQAFATSIKNEIFVRPDLVLTGLNQILLFNVKIS